MSDSIYALYELHRHQVLIAALNNPSLNLFSEAYLYALANRMDPSCFHSGWKSETQDDPFRDCYEVSHGEIEELVTYLERLWIDQEPIPSFYQLESKFGRNKRMMLINILRYCFLDKRFSPPFWQSILAPTSHPGEATSICRTFSPDDIFLS